MLQQQNEVCAGVEASLSNGFAIGPSVLLWEGDVSIVHLGGDLASEVCRLEKQCYQSPWSDGAILGEFTREISLRPAMLVGGELVAYSFNHIYCNQLHVLNVAVHPERRMMGLGKRLLAFVIAEAASRGACEAWLEVREHNDAALALYRSLSFAVVGRRLNYYRDNADNALLLSRDIRPDDRLALDPLWQGNDLE